MSGPGKGAAPAPSSLAGGEVEKAVWRLRERLSLSRLMYPDTILVHPEDVETILAALTPRHEAPAEGAGERGAPLTFTPFRDELREAQAALEPFSFIAERRSLSPATTVHLVHLDGTHIETLEVNSFWRARHAHSALRARSSAPEAREEALGNLLAVIHGDGGHRALEVGTKQAALEAEKIVAGLFAAPSADKLRIATDAFDAITDLSTALRNGGPDGSDLHDLSDNLNTAVDLAHEALAALKAEAC